MAFWLNFIHYGLLCKLVSTFVTMKSQLYLEVSRKMSQMCHTLSQMLITRHNMDFAVTNGLVSNAI